LSYPATGSTGDGYAIAKKFGHEITPTFPSLVAICTAETWVSGLEGLSLKNVRVTAKSAKNKVVFEDMGEMVFTANGVSGPLILSASAYLCGEIDGAKISIDLKPALSREQLDSRILRDFSEARNKNFANALDELLPKRLIETIIFLSQIPPQKKVNEITRAQRQTLVKLLKNLTLTPTSTAGFKDAVITKGGVNVREINPSSLMSKKQDGLFFAGEVIDTDAMTGGYNLQIAFSTGFLAGENAAEYVKEDNNAD
jgi:predicted Rossmann fold flavoprotein